MYVAPAVRLRQQYAADADANPVPIPGPCFALPEPHCGPAWR